nr:MAG TPA: Minor structural protein 4 [Caudoviricetes sp.]
MADQKKTYTVTTATTPARPRSKARRDGTGLTSGGASAIIENATAGNAQRASHANTADEASHALRADEAARAATAKTAEHATTADRATAATRADEATHAATATNATTAERANTADTATRAQSAQTAEHATTAATANRATHATEAETLRTPNFADGLNTGAGARIDATGNAEFQSMAVRGFFRAAEYQINRIALSEGDVFHTENGLVKSAEQQRDGRWKVVLQERFQGDVTGFRAGDVLRGAYNSVGTSGGAAEIRTSWLRVEAVDAKAGTLTASLYADNQTPEGRNAPPVPLMRLARWGNTTDPERQSHIMESATEGRIVRRVKVSAPIVDGAQSDGFVVGKLPAWLREHFGAAVADASDYVFARGIITQNILRYTPAGRPLAERVDRGLWSASARYFYEEQNPETGAFEISRVWHDGALYELARGGNGNTAPAAQSTHWTLIQAKPKDGRDGDAGLSVGVNLLDGTNFNTGTPIYASPRNPKWGEVRGKVSVLPGGKNGTNVVCAMGQPNVIRASIPGEKLTVGKTYVVSFWYRTDGNLRLWYNYPDNGHLERTYPERPPHSSPAEYNDGALHHSVEWKRYTQAFTWNGTSPYCGIYVDLNDAGSGKWIEICGLKVEEGDTPTTWCLSENDKIGTAGSDGRDGESYHTNLIENSSFAKDFEGWNFGYGGPTFDNSAPSPVPGTRVVKFTGDEVGALPFHEARQNVRQKLLPDTTYTYSVWVKTSQTMRNARIIVYPAPCIEQQIDYEHGGEWTRHAMTFTTGRNLESEQYVFLRLCTQTDPNAAVWFAAPKLEIGDTPTEWTTSENDRKGEKGDNGRGVSRMRSYYMLTTEGDAPQPDTSGWTETAPQPTKESPWLWSYERSEYSDGTADQTVVRLIGHYGKDGTSIRAQYSADARTWHDDFAAGDVWMRTGNGTTWGGALRVVGESGADGKSPVYDFAASSQLATASGTTAPTIRGTWQDAPPTLRDGEVLWYRLTAANGKITYGRLSGEKGKPGNEGKTSYTHIAYANSDDGKKDFTREEDLNRDAFEEFCYFGIYSDFYKSASRDYQDYVWTRLRGVDGKDGLAPNPNLLDGTNFESRVPWATFNVSESAYSFNGKPTQFGMSQLAEGQFRDLLVQEITSVLKVGQTYTFSAWMQARGTLTWIFSGVEFAEAPKVNGVQTGDASGSGRIPNNQNSVEFEKVTVSFKVNRITDARQYFYIRAWDRSSANIVDPKLEVGKIATPWCSSERDLRADYRELRFAVNGSPTQSPAISPDRRTPDGWNIAQPVVGVGQYLWMTSATVSRYETALLDRWSTPTRITPEDGKNGRDGEAPAMVYRGVWDASKEYYGTEHRRDAVFHNGAYYIARTDAGMFRGVDPTDKLKWNDFGASFESVATQLLLAEHANVGRWILSNGNLVSDLDDTRTHIRLDARDNELWLHSSYLENKPKAAESALSNIVLKASSGGLGTSTSFVSSDETYHSNTSLSWEGVSSVVEYVPDLSAPLDERSEAISGRMRRADNGIAVGVAGYAENYGKGEAFGGYFVNLKARGLIVGLKRVGEQNNNTTVSLELTDTRVVGLHDNFGNVDVRLPAKASEGQTIVFTQVGRGTMKILPPVGESNHRFGNYSDRILSEYSVNRSKTVRLTLLRNVNIGNERGINLWIVEE